MARYLLDTNILISAILTKAPVAPRLLKDLSRHHFAVSIISLAELYEGAYHRVNPDVSVDAIRQALSDITILRLTDEICLRFGELRAELRRQGRPHADLDLLIASTALHYNMAIFTRDLADFEDIPGLSVVSP